MGIFILIRHLEDIIIMGCIILKVRKVLKQECTDAPYKGWEDHDFPASTDPGAAISS